MPSLTDRTPPTWWPELTTAVMIAATSVESLSLSGNGREIVPASCTPKFFATIVGQGVGLRHTWIRKFAVMSVSPAVRAVCRAHDVDNDLVLELVQQFFDVTAGWSLVDAAERGHLELVKQLAATASSNSVSDALDFAAEAGDLGKWPPQRGAVAACSSSGRLHGGGHGPRSR
ncbi:unnamed protein product [Phytophthora lilii]|uniref:Unnamed protein product n=1 Tax=Phytophthora lilii TaxID=2077276 RepID=A0A9W6WTR1_9STRA|nr:unnamed protein product [Phytophthora lilii]